MEVSPLSREVMLRRRCCAQPLSARLQSGVRFFLLPYPQPCGLALRLTFPRFDLIMRPREGELRAYHVPRECQSGLGLAYPPVALRLRQVRLKHLNLATYLLVQAFVCQMTDVSILGLSILTTFISDSHVLPLPLDPSSRPL
jgi:hypothetical protein